MGKTAQQQHDERLPSNPTLAPGSKEKLAALLQAKSTSSQDQSQSDEFDWVGQLVKENPTLTREEVAEMVEDLGF
jgi:hypothetical protein